MAGRIATTLRRDVVYGGAYQISGTVDEGGAEGVYCVRLHIRKTGKILREVWSGTDGSYLFDYIGYISQGYYVTLHDYGVSPENAAIKDFVTPVAMS